MVIENTEETLRRYIELIKFTLEHDYPESLKQLHYEELDYLINEAIKVTDELKLKHKEYNVKESN